MKSYKLRLTSAAYDKLHRHLFPGDGLEAVAFALCGKLSTETETIYTIHKVELYPHEKCTVRKVDRVEWCPPDIVPLFEDCRKFGMHLLKIHCHPKHWPFFSEIDTVSDSELNETVTGWVNRNDCTISVIMLPDGNLFGRVIDDKQNMIDLTSIIVIGDEIKCHFPTLDTLCENSSDEKEDVQMRTKQAFGEGTTSVLKRLKIGIVGCSGTGSIVAESLGRLGVGQLVLVDYDKVERKNLNRILNTTSEDARKKKYKVDVLKRAIDAMGTNVQVIVIKEGLHSSKAYAAIAACDIVVGCMDTIDGRYLLNRIATYFCSAYIDVGVRLDADGLGGVNEIVGRVDYLQPGGSSLFSRGRYTIDQLKAADMARTNPDEHDRQKKEGYIKSANVDSPAVISVNMTFASMAVTEILARLHPFRDLPNSRYASTTFSISGGIIINEKDGYADTELAIKIGLGNRTPALDSPTLIYPTQ